jgi:putative ATP-dependent endonuclease of OLD family
MKLTNNCIRNFRGLKDVSIPLSSFVCITGENNAGKSSLMQALSLFLSGSSSKPTDYFDSATEIAIEVKLSQITPAELLLLAEEHRERIGELLDNGKLTLVRRYDIEGKSQLGHFGMVPKEPRFNPDSVASLVAGKRGASVRDAMVAVFPELADQLTGSTTQGTAKDLVEKLGISLPTDQKNFNSSHCQPVSTRASGRCCQSGFTPRRSRTSAMTLKRRKQARPEKFSPSS